MSPAMGNSSTGRTPRPLPTPCARQSKILRFEKAWVDQLLNLLEKDGVLCD